MIRILSPCVDNAGHQRPREVPALACRCCATQGLERAGPYRQLACLDHIFPYTGGKCSAALLHFSKTSLICSKSHGSLDRQVR
jgi:hypothetical protein